MTSEFPTISMWGVLLATLVCFVWAGLYWAALSRPIARFVGLPMGAETLPLAALVVAFGTRLVLAFGFAAILGYAGVETFGAGVLAGAALSIVTLLPLLVGQAAFGQGSAGWRSLAISVPDALLGCALLGGFVVLLR